MSGALIPPWRKWASSSALIEGCILGKHTFTILAEEFRDTQVATVHFHYLTRGGLLITAKSLDEHVRQLHRALIEGDPARDEVRRSFVRSFIRPHGMDT